MKGVNRLLVPVNGSEQDELAMELACMVARRSKAQIEAIYVIAVERNLPLDADVQDETERGETVLERAEHTAHTFDATIETSLLQSRDVGAAIVDESVQYKADVIVMGIPHKMRFGQYEMGPTANYVLKNASCRVWIARQISDR